MPVARYSVLMVCTANICRSPMAAGLLIEALKREGMAKRVRVDSAGTHALRGQRPDPRAQQLMRSRGVELKTMRARQFKADDFENNDLILCMDRKHYAILRDQCPEDQRHKLTLIMELAPQFEMSEVPDPYYGNLAGFENVATMLAAAVEGLVPHIREAVFGE